MCILVFDWQPGTEQPLLLLGNRDEFHQRPTAALAQWPDQPRIHAGRDLQAGGSWLGIAPGRRFAALTNIREPEAPQPLSRGELVSDYLAGSQSPAAYIQQLVDKAGQYSGFNLLTGDANELWFLHSRTPVPRLLAPGIYGLCNASLDTPWPKLVRLRSAFSQLPRDDDAALFNLMQDTWRPADAMLPDTGMSLTIERTLSSIFIRGDEYGTRATSLLRMDTGGITLTERSFAPGGIDTGSRSLRTN